MVKKTIIILFFFLFLATYIFFLLKDSGQFKEIHNKSFSFCKSFSAYGAEDIAEVEDTDYLILSLDSREYPRSGNTGSLKVFSKNKEDFTYFQQVGFPKDFYPHGIDIKKFNNTYFIAVVNHPTLDSTSIETFNIDLTHKEIRHLKTHSHPLFTTGNDIAILSPTEVLMTEDFGSNSHLLNTITQYLRISTGSIVHFDLATNEAKKVSPSLFYANGIVYDLNEKTVYVSEMLGRKLSAFLWDGQNLTLQRELKMPHAIDNLTLFKEDLLAAGHPQLLGLKKMRDDRLEKSSSVVLQIKKDFSKVQDLYENKGSELASSSVAFRFANKILIGSVFDTHVLLCTTD